MSLLFLLVALRCVQGTKQDTYLPGQMSDNFDVYLNGQPRQMVGQWLMASCCFHPSILYIRTYMLYVRTYVRMY